MLKFSSEHTKREKLIIIGLWVIALYFIIGSSLAMGTSIFLGQVNGITEGLGVVFVVLGIGLLLEKGWALQISAVISFMIILASIAVFFSYLDGGSLDIGESIEGLVMLVLSLSCYFILTHKVSMQLYDMDFMFFNRVKSILSWTIGVGFLGFCVSLLYMTVYVDGVYRGFVVVYGTIFFVDIGFLIGLIKALRMKKK